VFVEREPLDLAPVAVVQPLPCDTSFATDDHMKVVPRNSSDTSWPSRMLMTRPSPSSAPSARSSLASCEHARRSGTPSPPRWCWRARSWAGSYRTTRWWLASPRCRGWRRAPTGLPRESHGCPRSCACRRC
jgi:hypothetical protein